MRRPRSGSLLTSLRRTFRCRVEGAESSSTTKLLVVSRPRASFDAGLLMPRFFHAPRSSLRIFGDARDLFPPFDVPRSLDGPCSPCGAHVRARLPDPPLRMSSAYEARDCASSLKDGHAPCSSLDAHGVLAFSVPAHAFVLRRSRSHSLSDPAVVRLYAFAQNVPRHSPPRSRPRALGRAHLSVSTVLAFRGSRATLHRLTVYGLANSCHVSTRAGGDPLLFEDRAFTSHPAIAPALAFRPWRSPCRTAPRFVPALRRSRSAAAAR